MSSELAVASSLSEAVGNADSAAAISGVVGTGTLSISLDANPQKKKKQLVVKGGGVLVYSPMDEDDEDREYCMEERRAMQPRYLIALQRAILKVS